jgi:hypothetical protein
VTGASVCVHCKERIHYNSTIRNQWAHWHGDTWCHDARGFTATPLQRATPVYHESGDVL